MKHRNTQTTENPRSRSISNSTEDPIVIVGAARTPIGGMLGSLSPLSAVELGAAAIRSAVERAQLSPEDIDEVIFGCVLPGGLGQAPARQASILAGIPKSTGATTINKVCASGMKSVMLAHDSLLLGNNQIMVAGGMESMSNAPYLLDKARQGYRLGHGHIKDHMMHDGLEDAYEKGKSMGAFAESTAEHYGFTREIQDEFARTSLLRAKEATEKGLFQTEIEITPINVTSKKGEVTTIKDDELPLNAKPEKIAGLKPAFKENGTITAANSSSISDGAAALVLMPLSEAKRRNLKPIAKIVGQSSYATDPKEFTTAPIGAINSLLKKINWSKKDVDLYEINEAFAVVVLAAIKDLNLNKEQVNIHGGGCALGHPIGASGARIITTLLGALKSHNKTRGIASLCIGGGEATAIAIERL